MIDDFIFSANAVLPIFLVIGAGYLLRQKEFLSPKTIGEMNKLIFVFALPALLFRDIYQADFVNLFDPAMILWLLAIIITKFILIWIFAEIYLRKKTDLISAFVQVSYRANYAIVGIPLVSNIMDGNDTGLAALSAAFIVTTYNILAVIVLTTKNKQNGGLSFALFKSIFVGICKNPSILGIVFGVTLNLLNIALPRIAWESVNYFAMLSTPLALLAVGGSVQISEVKRYFKPTVVASILKIVVLPLLFVPISAWMGFRGEHLVVLFVLLANPSAIICYVMAARMNGNPFISSATILVTTAFAPVTITLGVSLLRILSLI
ncbi:MAG: AEC family transporter [Defluviitaleaceae bacterium]|nr:AEC family transporter [Defluviitaleaceae bacterium]